MTNSSGRSADAAGLSPSVEPVSPVSTPDGASIPIAECVHLPDYAGEVCAGCGEEIDQYGNTANDFNACSFPDCGCDGARLCMAGVASEWASKYNVEGMYSSRDPRPRMRFLGAVHSGEFEPRDSDGSGAAGETQSGSTVGDSAGPKGHRP